MSSSSKSKKNLERFINNDKEKNSSEKINNKNKFIYNNKIPENNSDFLELNNSKNEKNYKNLKIDQEKNIENNQINELIEEGIILLKKNKNPKEPFLDNNDIESINYEKMLKKIIDLNRSLISIKTEKHRLNNEKNIFSKGLNEINQKANINDKDVIFFPNINYKNTGNNSARKQKSLNDNNKEELMKQYQEDLNFFNELVNEFNEDLNILK